MIEKFKKLKPSRLIVVGCFVATFFSSNSQCFAFQAPDRPARISGRNPPARLSIEKLLEIQPLIDGKPLPNFPLPPVSSGYPPIPSSATNPSFASGIPGTSPRMPPALDHSESAELSRLLMDKSFGGVAADSSELRTVPGRLTAAGLSATGLRGRNSSQLGSSHPNEKNILDSEKDSQFEALNPLRSSPAMSRQNTSWDNLSVGSEARTVGFSTDTASGDRRQNAAAIPSYPSNPTLRSQVDSSQSRQSVASPNAAKIGLYSTQRLESGVASSHQIKTSETANDPGRQVSQLRAPVPSAMNRSLTQAITSPNLSQDLGDSLEDVGSFHGGVVESKNTVTTEVLESLKESHDSELQSGRPMVSHSVSSSSREVDLKSGSNVIESDKMLAVEGRMVSEASQVSMLEDVPTYQPYRSDESTNPSLNSTALVQLESAFDTLVNRDANSEHGVAYGLFDFAAMRSEIRKMHQAEGPSSELQLIEAAYLNQRQEYDRALSAIGSIDPSELGPDQAFELSLQQAYVGVGAGQISLVQTALRDMGLLDRSIGSKAFLASVEAYFLAKIELLQNNPDYVRAANLTQQSMKSIRIAIAPEADAPLTSLQKQHLAFILADDHCMMGKCVALGPYENQQEASAKWYQSSLQIISKLVDKGKAHSMLKLHCLEQQTKTFCLLNQAKSLPVMVNHYATIQRQLKGQLPPEEEALMKSQLADLLGVCGMSAFQGQDFVAADRYASDAIVHYQSLQNERALTQWESYCQSTCHWLKGAVALTQQDLALANANFDRYLQTVPASPSLRMEAEQAEQGERMAVASVAFWNVGRKQQAIELNRMAVTQIQIAIEQGLADMQRMDQPLQNLAQMEALTGTTSDSPVNGRPVLPVSASGTPPMVPFGRTGEINALPATGNSSAAAMIPGQQPAVRSLDLVPGTSTGSTSGSGAPRTNETDIQK